mmetsp:Transcript_4944/g.12391  ORF Transcript_4944/g.12391 Transcript_4944/m.12391 type:complete len:408 (+) Transcript_4944:187-1410(+)|eukprot:CAMPEP_0178991632 /NCGR_PEP_ID=MMETSP0795-20121207/5641_1 /TAXON_ID=88552 /ORGANISM="Amoebophrya sp., Strain Ameob2" /LENGTH=407 /DNA_ID=CAMNT_0020683373 /DNA_START=130 /DNA_END=1353 /DNA_ORIENTATION=-
MTDAQITKRLDAAHFVTVAYLSSIGVPTTAAPAKLQEFLDKHGKAKKLESCWSVATSAPVRRSALVFSQKELDAKKKSAGAGDEKKISASLFAVYKSDPKCAKKFKSDLAEDWFLLAKKASADLERVGFSLAGPTAPRTRAKGTFITDEATGSHLNPQVGPTSSASSSGAGAGRNRIGHYRLLTEDDLKPIKAGGNDSGSNHPPKSGGGPGTTQTAGPFGGGAPGASASSSSGSGSSSSSTGGGLGGNQTGGQQRALTTTHPVSKLADVVAAGSSSSGAPPGAGAPPSVPSLGTKRTFEQAFSPAVGASTGAGGTFLVAPAKTVGTGGGAPVPVVTVPTPASVATSSGAVKTNSLPQDKLALIAQRKEEALRKKKEKEQMKLASAAGGASPSASGGHADVQMQMMEN